MFNISSTDMSPLIGTNRQLRLRLEDYSLTLSLLSKAAVYLLTQKLAVQFRNFEEPIKHVNCTGVISRKPPSIEIKDLSISYGGNTILSNTNLSVKAGRITALLGPSGCGKSSLIGVINRLSDFQPCKVSGEVLLGNKDVFASGTDLLQLRREVGMVFQKPNPFPMSIAENIRFPLREQGILKGEQLEQRVQESLGQVGLWDEVKDRLNQSALTLSGGQQQRLCIARCLSLRPSVLLLDEPCSALDPKSTAIIEDLILRLRGRYTIIIVTHNLMQARSVADDIAVFGMANSRANSMTNESGCIVESGSAAQIFDAPKHAATIAYMEA